MPILKYEQIADSIRARITEGEFPPGALLPSGRDLCEQWGVSRATVIKAFEVLRQDGLVAARQGQGFRVVETPLARPAGGRRAGRTRVSGGRPFRRLGRPSMEEPPARIAEALGASPGQRALRRDRLVLLDDGTPMTFVSAWFPADIADACPRLSQVGPIAEGTTHYVARQTGRTPVQGTDVSTVRLATDTEAALFDMSPPLPVALDLHVAHDRQGRVLVVEEGITPATMWELTETYPMSMDR